MTSKKNVCTLILGAIFLTTAHQAILRRFSHILPRFPHILREFARIFLKSKLLGVNLHPAYTTVVIDHICDVIAPCLHNFVFHKYWVTIFVYVLSRSILCHGVFSYSSFHWQLVLFAWWLFALFLLISWVISNNTSIKTWAFQHLKAFSFKSAFGLILIYCY